MSRPSFRARPIDIAQALAIVRDESVLNDESQAVAREVTHAHKNLDKDNEEVRRPRPFPRAPPFHFTGWTYAKAWSSSSKIESPPALGSGRLGAVATSFPPFFSPRRTLHERFDPIASSTRRSSAPGRAETRVSGGASVLAHANWRFPARRCLT
jgi:hypothetical protein